MELRHLRYFVGVGEESHFGRAAKRLHIAQPPLSKQIQDLERELGYALFERLPRGVRLTAAGKLYLDDARRILKEVQDARRRAERIAQGKAGTLRVGIATALSLSGLVADSFQAFQRRHPDVELELHHLLSIHQMESIRAGRLDVGFAASLIPPGDDLAHWEFAQDRVLLAVSEGHPLIRRKRVWLRDLRDMPFVWFARWANTVFYDQLMLACARGGLDEPNIVQVAADRDTIMGLVQCRVGVAWVNESAGLRHPSGVQLIPVVDMKARLPFNLVWRKDDLSPLLKKFVAQARAL